MIIGAGLAFMTTDRADEEGKEAIGSGEVGGERRSS